MTQAQTNVTHLDPPIRSGPITRREEYFKGARTLLENWRYDTWMQDYSDAPYGPEVILPGPILEKIAHSTRFTTIEDLKGIGWSISWASKHGSKVLELLSAYDQKHVRMKEAEKSMRIAEKKEQTAQRQA
ncbi:hypothetical protein BJ138DRAFT_1009424, partial [Hygrophoropsis aurantiaca]